MQPKNIRLENWQVNELSLFLDAASIAFKSGRPIMVVGQIQSLGDGDGAYMRVGMLNAEAAAVLQKANRGEVTMPDGSTRDVWVVERPGGHQFS